MAHLNDSLVTTQVQADNRHSHSLVGLCQQRACVGTPGDVFCAWLGRRNEELDTDDLPYLYSATCAIGMGFGSSI